MENENSPKQADSIERILDKNPDVYESAVARSRRVKKKLSDMGIMIGGYRIEPALNGKFFRSARSKEYASRDRKGRYCPSRVARIMREHTFAAASGRNRPSTRSRAPHNTEDQPRVSSSGTRFVTPGIVSFIFSNQRRHSSLTYHMGLMFAETSTHNGTCFSTINRDGCP